MIEQCFVCRVPLQLGDIQRRVMVVGTLESRGETVVQRAPVSLCPACDAAQEEIEHPPPGWGKFLLGKLFWFLVITNLAEPTLILWQRGRWILALLHGAAVTLAVWKLCQWKRIRVRKRGQPKENLPSETAPQRSFGPH